MNTGLSRFIVAGLLAICCAPASAQDTAMWTWGVAQPVPEARSEVSVATDGRFIYLLGGFAAASSNPDRPAAPTDVFRYDPATDVWDRIAALPEGVNHAGLVTLDGKLFVIGGYREATFEPTGAVHILDLTTGEWTSGASLPTARGALAAVVRDGTIHVIGGHDGTRSLGTHETYDPATNIWTSAASLNHSRNHHAAAVIAGVVYVFGGRDETTAEMTSTEAFDPATGRWREVAPMPTGRSGIAAAVMDGNALVFGGETFGSDRKTFDEAEAYDPLTDTWTTLPPMPTARHGLGAATVGGRIHVLAGGPEAGLSYSGANESLERRAP
jgi:N-acetylneuraminic acid mutarotase